MLKDGLDALIRSRAVAEVLQRQIRMQDDQIIVLTRIIASLREFMSTKALSKRDIHLRPIMFPIAQITQINSPCLFIPLCYC
jgi:hypothetical protein